MSVVGFYGNWGDVTWWKSRAPFSCFATCHKAPLVFEKTRGLDRLVYSFVLLTDDWLVSPTTETADDLCLQNRRGERWGYDKLNIKGETLRIIPKSSPDNTGKAPYESWGLVAGREFTLPGPTMSPARFSVTEFVRLAHQNPYGSQAADIALGGWTDCSTFKDGFEQNAAQLVANMILSTFADGVDLDFEQFAYLYKKEQGLTGAVRICEIQKASEEKSTPPIERFIKFIRHLRQALDNITDREWVEAVNSVNNFIQNSMDMDNAVQDVTVYNSSQWQSSGYPVNQALKAAYAQYAQDLIKKGKPKYRITYTTRYNAFVCDSTMLLPSTSETDGPADSDGEGIRVMQVAGSLIDRVNLMNYDLRVPSSWLTISNGLLKQWYRLVFNSASQHMPICKIGMGFEVLAPGEQAPYGNLKLTDADIRDLTVYLVDMLQVKTIFYWPRFWKAVDPDSTETPKKTMDYQAFSQSESSPGSVQHAKYTLGATSPFPENTFRPVPLSGLLDGTYMPAEDERMPWAPDICALDDAPAQCPQCEECAGGEACAACPSCIDCKTKCPVCYDCKDGCPVCKSCPSCTDAPKFTVGSLIFLILFILFLLVTIVFVRRAQRGNKSARNFAISGALVTVLFLACIFYPFW